MPLSENWADIREAMEAPFHSTEVAWRALSTGLTDKGPWCHCAPYVSARAVQRRLDDAIGAPHWRPAYRQWGETGIICSLAIQIDGEWVTKEDGAAETRRASHGDIDEQMAVKGGLSQALKRAAVLWGIGRYLYDLPMPMWAECDKRYRKGWTRGRAKGTDGKYISIWWLPPRLPRWALPIDEAPPQQAEMETSINQVRHCLAHEIGCKSPEDAEKVLRWINPAIGLAELKDPMLVAEPNERRTIARDILARLAELREAGQLSTILDEVTQ